MADCIKSEEYVDFFVRYSALLEEYLRDIKDFCITRINEKWSILSINRSEYQNFGYEDLNFNSVPDIYSLQLAYGEVADIENAGIYRVQNQPYLNLKGQGVLIGLVDTGIDYLSEAFRSQDGKTRIAYLYDQEEEKEYSSEDINAAIYAKQNNENPYSIVSSRDLNGHGTALAGLAGGYIENQYVGAAPYAEFAVVKLRQAKEYLKEYYFSEGTECYSEVDIVRGIASLNDFAEKAKKPISIITGFGSNLGSHAGTSVLSDLLNDISGIIGRCVTTCAGNYADSRLHFGGCFEQGDSVAAELRCPRAVEGLWVSIWFAPGAEYTLTIISPTGQVESPIGLKTGIKTTLVFRADASRAEIYYGVNDGVTERSIASIRLFTPSEGLWVIRVNYLIGLRGSVDMWLSSVANKSNVYFINGTPENTITEPGNSINPITSGAYDSANGSLYPGNGRGYTSDGRIKPDFVAGGVNVPVLRPDARPGLLLTQATGSSLSAAIVGGAAALLLEYGVVKKQFPFMRTYTIKNFMARSTIKREGYSYPNPVLGYGILDLYNIFLDL